MDRPYDVMVSAPDRRTVGPEFESRSRHGYPPRFPARGHDGRHKAFLNKGVLVQ